MAYSRGEQINPIIGLGGFCCVLGTPYGVPVVGTLFSECMDT